MTQIIKVRVPKNLDTAVNWYLTPGEVYSAEVQMTHDDGDMLFVVTGDNQMKLLCLRYACAHLAGLDWEIVE